MPNNLDSKDSGVLAGAVYFVVGRGTEGGSASYRLSIAGVSQSEWGQLSSVIQNSGYSLGAIQVDLGQRGIWSLGATEGRSLREGEMTYVDAVIAESSAYAVRIGLPYTADHAQLRANLLTHGNGQGRRTSLTFIDTDTRDSINAWANSVEGRQWIHRHIDYAQVKNATQTAVNLLDKHPHNISKDRQFETICVLAKTANQYPGFLDDYERVLSAGGGYEDIVQKANELHARNSTYHGNRAIDLAEKYRTYYEDPVRQLTLDNAHAKVSSPNFNPSTEAVDLDIQMALSAIGQRPPIDPTVWRLQENLNTLNVTNARGQELVLDGNLGGPNSRTNQAIAAFKQQHGLTEPISNAELLIATQVALRVKQSLNFDRPVHDGLPGPVPTPPLVNGLPDYLVPGSNTLSLQSSAAQPTPDIFDRVFEALINQDDDALRALSTEYFQSPDGQQLLQEGRELRESYERQADALALAQGRPLPTGYSIGTLTGKQDPRDWDHPDHALYSAIRRELPRDVSDEMTAHVMLQARRGGIHDVDRLADVAVHDGQAFVSGRNYTGITPVDLSQTPPPMEDTVQQSQRLDEKLALDHQERLAQQHEQSRNGPSRSL